MNKNIEREAKKQALREKFEKLYSPLLVKSDEEVTTQEEIQPIIYEEVDFTEYENSEELKNRIKDKNHKNAIYISESKKLTDRLSKAGFLTNGTVDSLMYRNVKTEYQVNYFKKKIGDNPKNKEVLLDLFKNEKANFNMFTSFASSGKTFTINTIFNEYREYRYNKDRDFLIDLCLNGISDPNISTRLNKMVSNRLNELHIQFSMREHKIEKMKNRRESKAKIQAEVNALEKERKDAVIEAQLTYFIGEFEKRKMGIESEIQEINDYIENNPTSLIQILVTPNRIQNEQNQEEEKYNYTAIIGQNENKIEFDADTNYSVVIEKLTEVLNKIERNPLKAKINLVIDEAHILVEQKSFRSDAINKLLQVVARVLELDGTVLFMTATPENLKCFNFDKIISFIPVEDVKNADKIKVFMRNEIEEEETQEENIEEQEKKKIPSMHDYIVSVVKQLNNPLVRYNTKDGIKRAKETLVGLGYEVEIVTADDKKKALFRSIVKKSALTKADKWICSSVIEVGTNIVGVVQDDGSIELVDITPTYCLSNINQMSFDSIEQFFARVRYHVSEYALIMPDKRKIKKKKAKDSKAKNSSNVKVVKPEENFVVEKIVDTYSIQPVEVLLREEIEKVEIYYSKMKKIAEAFVAVAESDEEAILNINKVFGSCESFDGSKYNCDCIYLDEETLEVKVDTISLWKNVYKKFIQQYYYNPEAFIERLENLFGIKTEIVEDNIELIETNKVSNTQAAKDHAKKCLNNLAKKGLEELTQVLTKEIPLSEIENKTIRDNISAIYQVKHYVKYLKQAYDLNIELPKIIKAISIYESDCDVEKFLKEALYVRGNELFLKSKTTLSIEHDIIMDELYRTNDKGNIVQKRISEEDITNISKKIGKALNKRVKKRKNSPSSKEKTLEYGIGYNDTLKLLEYIFWITKVDDNKFKIKGLKTNIREPKENENTEGAEA